MDVKLFTGEITLEIRNALKNKRIKLGLNYSSAANFCQVDVSTYRKWERGPTKQCEMNKILRIKKFLNLDKKYTFVKYDSKENCYQARISCELPEILNYELDQLLNIIHISYRYDDFFKKQIVLLHKFIEDQIDEFVLQYNDDQK